MLYRLGERAPILRGAHFIAPGCQIAGSVDIGSNVNIWFNTVIRGDNDWIVIGDNTNIQDGAVLHADPGVPLSIGRHVTVGHKVMLHGCTIGDESLIGINSIVLNNARIGKYCLIGANTLIPENKVIPDGSLVLGSPGKVVRSLTDEEKAKLLEGASLYVENGQRFAEQLQPL